MTPGKAWVSEQVASFADVLPTYQKQKKSVRRMSIGSEPQLGGGVDFRVWAPQCREVMVELEGASANGASMQREPDGYFSLMVPTAEAGMRYCFRLDRGETTLPDPASRYQPNGPHGPSEIVDSDAFGWTDVGWRGYAAAQEALARMADTTVAAMRAGKKLLIAGNGGSAAGAQHIAGEFISRLMFDHAQLPAIALTTDTSALTATANDYGYELVFERQVLGLGQSGDVFLAISTSGNSPNILRALQAARERGLTTLGFAGAGGGKMAGLCDIVLMAPSKWTPVIQQVHITAAHIYCALIERAMFPAEAARLPTG
jgi:D-sedoheptulose 7-phosphate isomerase